ncbi:PREDICTED: ATP-binding cassette sub-family A member 13 [Aptenodytes forsteri]|nr:PREDICTED: ATP-binding cassette sub-family A member 13 [Aptenodytes forsteri]
MGHAVHQFKALFWKNWLCRVRQPVLSLTEILWPCVLFLILAAIRFQEPPKYKENCYLEARDLPSRGLYPFMRTLFCNVGSRCKNTSYTTQKNNCLRKLRISTKKNLRGLSQMDLNEVEEMISRAENLYKQPYFWNLLHSLPRLESNSFYTEDGLGAIAQFLKVIQNTLASLKDLAMMPLGKSFYEVVKTALNLTATSVQDRSLEGFQYNLSLGDVLWNPHAVRAELESRFGFDDLHVEKLLSYTAQLTKIPTGETLEQFVCSALSSVAEDEANKENNEEGCISAWHEAKLYLVHAVSKLRLYAQVFEQWFSRSPSQKLLLELERIIADLMSQFLDDREAGKLFSEINTLIQQWNEKSDAYFSEGYTASHNLILHLEKMQSVLQDVPQWPVTKRLLLVDGAIRNVIAQYLSFTEGWVDLKYATQFCLYTVYQYTFLHDGGVTLIYYSWASALSAYVMLMSNASYMCNDVLRVFEKTLRLPQGSDDIDILAVYVCPGNGSEVTFKLSNQVQSLKESVLLLQKVTQGQQSPPDSIMDDYLGWQEIEEQLTENYAYYCEMNQLLSTEAPSEEDVHFSSCQEQLLFSLINNTLEEILFAFEGNPYWKDLTTFVSWTCEVAQYMNEEAGSAGSQSELIRNVLNTSSFLKREENLRISGENEMDHLFHLVEVIEEINMLDFSASSNQSLIENVLNNTIIWMKNFAEGKESATNFSLAVSELYNELRKYFQPLQRFWMKEETEVFWHIVKIVFYELDSRLSHLSQVEEEEVLETLFRIIFSTAENKIRNRSMLLLRNILTDWPELNIAALNHLKHLSESFLRNLYEVRSLTDDHVNVSFSTIHGVSNASSLLLSNATFIYKVQELGEIVHDFFKNIQKLNSTSVASFLPILFSLYQNDNLVLNIEGNSTLLTFLYETSKDTSSFQVWHDFQDRDRVFDFLSETFGLLWNFTSKSLCEKLLIIYNYTEFQAQSLAQKGKKEMQVVYSTLSSLKTLFIDEELQTAAFCYLEQFLGIFPECLVNNGCIDFYLSNSTSVDHSAEVYNLLLLPLDSVLSNVTNLGDKVSVPSALHCTFTWLQTWTEVFEEASKILNLNSTFFVCLRNDLANLSESLSNATHDELCNNTAMVIVEATTEAMNLLKIIFEGGGDLNDWKDFEAFLANLQNVFNNAVDVTSSLKSNSLESVLEMMGVMITELQKSILKVVNGELLNSWLDTFISGGSEGEDRGAGVFSIGNSLSTILKLSQKELGIILAEIKDTTAFFKSVSQGKYMVCISIFQNITKLILDNTLKDLSSVELLAGIKTLLKNKTFEIQESSSSHLDVEIEPFLHEKNTSLLMEFFQDVFSKLDSNLQGEHKTFLQKLIETAALNIELVRKALKIFKSSSFTGFPLRDGKEFLKHMVTLVQNMRNVDVEFLISQFKQVQRSLDNFFKNIKPLYIENSELRMLTDWWDAFQNNSCNWNLTGLWQITRLFEQDELYDVEEMFHFLLNVNSLTERLAHGNITEALTEVYAFILTQEAKMPMFTAKEFSNQVESLLMLLETLTDTSNEPAEASVCFSAAFCWTLTTATPQSDPTFKPCEFVHSNSTLSYNAVIQVVKELKLITLEDSSSCTMEDFQMDITRNLTCFFHQIKEWNSILLKFSDLHHVNGSVLKKLLDFWNELSLYTVPLQVNNTYSINCSSTPKRQVALQIVEALGSMPVAEMEMAKGVLEQLDDLYGGLSWNRHSRTSLIKTVLTNFKNMTSDVSRLLDTEAVLSFLSVIQPLMTLSSVGNQTYSMLMILSALNGNSNISDNFENFWFPIVTSIEDLLVNFNVRHLLAVIDQEFQLLRLATGQSSSVAFDALIQQFNTSSVDAMLRNFEDIQEIVNSFLCECKNKNYPKIMHALILLMANENSSSDLLLVVKDIIDFLELFQNKSKEDYTGMLFVDGRLSREKLNTHTANSVLLNSLLHIIADLAVMEEALHTNNIDLQIVDFIDSFFDNAQYRECKDGLTSHLILSVIEGVTLVRDRYQDIERMWPAFNKGDCESMAYINQKLSNTWESFLRALQNTSNGSCECQLTLGNIQRRLQMVAENLKLQLSENPVAAFLSNFNLLNDMKVKECVHNLTQLRLDIGSSVNISEETVSTILEASISHSKVFYSAFVVALTGRCDEEVLSLLLKLPENSKTSLAVEELCSLPALDLYTMFVLIIQNWKLRHIIYKIKIPSEIGNVLNMLLDVVSSISSLLNKAHHVMENLPVFLQGIQNTGVLDISALQQFLQGGQFRSSAVGSLESLIKAVCKEESSFFSNTNLFIDMPRIMGLLEDNMAKYSIPEDSTPFCLKLYQEILQSSNGALLWTFLKPLLHGKILYNSNINMIDLVMEKANFTFGFVENLKTYSESWLRMSEVFKTSGSVLTVSRLQEALQSNFIKHFIESNLDIDMEKLFKKMQVYETMMNKMLNSSASKQIDLLSQLVVNISSCVLLDRFQPFDSVEKLEEKAHELMQQKNFLASIIFNTPKNKTQDSSNLLPRHISYTIRTSVLYSMRTDLIKNPAWKSHPQKLPADGFKYNHIFIPLQDMIERAIISAQTGTDTSEPAIQVQAMPYPCHTSDLFLNNIGFFFPLMMMLTWMVSVAGMVRKLVYEREIHLEEYMKTMGVHPAIHFFAWFLENVIVLTISSCALTIILKASGIFAYSNGFLIFLFLLDFGVTVIMLSYFLGAFFSSANTAALCASLVYMISFLPYIVLLVLQNQLSFTNQTIMCLLSTTAFGQGVFFITFFEGQEIGIQWNNVHQSMAQGGYMTFGWMCWMMFFDSILYSIGGWYFSNIIPGKFGLKKRWYFPFTASYWKNLWGTERRKRHYLNSNMFFFNENFQEKGFTLEIRGPCIEGATIGVVLLSLTKEHVDGQKAAVKDLSLTFHRGQITALLGPNGAGKTTVISLLTGLYPPSSGTIIINGKDIRSDLAAIRTELGVCPQYDVLFNILTVREHLLLYGSVKAPGWTKERLNQQVSGALEDVDLSQHQYKPVGALSGGMKRRLSIAISFIGNSKTVVLDEPTSGVDPCSRRSIWDVLLKYKSGCTLIFTTHHLDEAEVLSDHIAILQRGQLRCCGSPSYLRETYGQGHSLTLVKKPSVFEMQDPKHIVQVTSLVQTHIPEAFLKENSGTELTYVIPKRADKTSFKGLFQALDQSLHHLHVTGYGISDTTLEEVFLKLLQDSEKMPYVPQAAHLDRTNGAESAWASSVRGARLVLAQIVALLMKRFLHTRRDWRGSLSNVLLPVLFVALAMALFSVKPLAIDYPSLKLTPRLYDNAESFFSTEDDNLGNLSQILLRYFFDWDHTCMHSKQGKNNSCWQMESTSPQDSCGCVAEQEMCPSFNTSAPYVKNKKGQILYNLSGFLVEEYLVRPSNKARYGGWSFGGRKTFELQDKKLNNTKSKPLAKVWYNQKGFHSLPSYLNELSNFILWLNLPPNVDWRQYGITLYSQPYGGALLDEDKIMENVRQCGVALCIMLGFSILTASIGSAVVKDRVSGTKRLQHITGLGYKTYWLANFCYDMLVYMVPVTLCVGVISAFQLSAFTFRKNLAATVLLLILFGYATLPWMYLVSRFFSSSDVAFISYISLNFVFGLCAMLVTLLPRLLAIISKAQSFQNIYNILKWAFIIFPQFCLGQGLIELSYNQIKFDLTSNFGIDSYVSPFEMNFLGWIFVEMALQGTLLLLLRLFLHWDLLQKPRGQCSINSMVSPSEDVDVEMERQRLFGGRTGNDVLLLYNLRKCYGGFSKKNTAVESISLGIPRGECFGLLGTNGAGKSTTFKMLTGDIIPSAGRAVIRTPTGSEMDILSASAEGILIGYCPQQDALDELLTGWEHLYYYCTLRGIPKQDIRKVAEDLINRLHFKAHADKLVRTYSAGTKRKLSTAVALVGKPQILLLDEPSSGMDPCSKRYLWKTILKEVQDGCAAVLTSHSMEECEALCTRLAIMVNGSFKCLGSPQHIKNRFGDGYSVKVWLSEEINYRRIILDRLQLHFPGTQFKGQHLNLLEYHVPRSQGCLAELFRVLENHKAFLQIKHYSISQNTLEQVFINFATQQQGVSHSSQESPVVHHDHLPV